MDDELFFRDLPPTKRYKLLQKNNDDDRLSSLFLPPKKRTLELHRFCPPVKKRIITNREEEEEEEDYRNQPRLPAKKRVMAPNPFLENPFFSKEEESDKEEDDGVACRVCGSPDGDPEDPIVFCDGCELTVHAACYGDPLTRGVPEGEWFCRRCEKKNNNNDDDNNKGDEEMECCLCPGKGGAVKETTDGRWAHVGCALLVPEAFFRDPVGREGLDLSRVPERRWRGECCVCAQHSVSARDRDRDCDRDGGGGCVIDCSEEGCGLAFHASCGVEAGFCVEYREGRTSGGGIVVGFCREHTRLWRKQQTTGKFKFVPQQHQKKKTKAKY